MSNFKLFLVLLLSLSLVLFIGCSGESEDEISADEIMEDILDEDLDELATASDETGEEAEELAGKEETDSFEDFYTPEYTEDGRYVVQVKVFASERTARRLADDLTGKGYPAYVAEVESPTAELTGTYYRVRVGNFIGVSLAREFGEKVVVADLDLDYWVDNKSNDNAGMGGGGESYGTSSESESSSYPTVQQETTPSTTTSDWGTSGSDEWGTSGSTSESATSTPAQETAPAPSTQTETQAPAPTTETPSKEESSTSTGDDWGTGSSGTEGRSGGTEGSSGDDFDF